MRVFDVEVGLALVAAERLGRRDHLEQRPQEFDVEMLLGAVDRPVVQLVRGELVEIFGHVLVICLGKRSRSRAQRGPSTALATLAAPLAAQQPAQLLAHAPEVELARELAQLAPFAGAEVAEASARLAYELVQARTIALGERAPTLADGEAHPQERRPRERL